MKIKVFSIFLLLFTLLFGSIGVRTGNVQAQGQWFGPYRLSNPTGLVGGGAAMAVDPYGIVHAFWVEADLQDNNRLAIHYARFDGETWSPSNDIYVAPRGILLPFVSVFADQNGMLHLVWVQGNRGPVLYSSAPASDALSAQSWSTPVSLEMPGFWARMIVDQNGVYHVLFSDYYGPEPGIYYSKSTDGGIIWSTPVWLDPDIPDGYAPQTMQFAMDEVGGLHAVWHYVDNGSTGGLGTWVRYAHSLDGGESWSSPFTIDIADERIDELRLPYPNLVIQGETIHVIYAGDSDTHREHRISNDRGRTWGPPSQIFGDLLGQALGDDLALDSLNRIHFMGQLRYPHGLYHATWENGFWSVPSLVYLIAQSSADSIEDRIHVHNVRMVIRAGNQIVVTFTNSPTDPHLALYSMYYTVDDAPLETPFPTPSPAPPPTETPPPEVVVPTVTPNPLLAQGSDNLRAASTTPSSAGLLAAGVIPSLFLLLGIVAYHYLKKRGG